MLYQNNIYWTALISNNIGIFAIHFNRHLFILMKLVDHLKERSPYERVFHAVLYEVVGIITSTPLIMFFSGKNLSDSGVIAVLVSVIATIWNYIYNYIYDWIRERYTIRKSALVRVVHGVLFEVGLIFITVPIISFTMGLTLWKAFQLECGMLIYFFPYTIVFNWLYDKLKSYFIKRLLA